MLNNIVDNPYRILGVYANASKKDIIASKGRISAFARVGKTVELQQDFNLVIPRAVIRTPESVNQAESRLTLQNDMLKHAMFWFVKDTPIDEMALTHLSKGNVTMAKSILEKTDNYSSLQNRIVIYLLTDDLESAFECAETLYLNYLPELIKAIGCDTIQKTHDDLFRYFADIVCENCDFEDMDAIYATINHKSFKDYIFEIRVKPIIYCINKNIEYAQSQKGPEARYKAGYSVLEKTYDAIVALYNIMPNLDVRFQMLVDKLANEILQCGIDYYNKSNDYDCSKKALALMEHALHLAVGEKQQQRCEDNYNRVKKIADNLLPEEVEKEIDIVNSKVRDFKKACTIFDNEHSEKAASITNTQVVFTKSKRPAKLANELILSIRSHIVFLRDFVRENKNHEESYIGLCSSIVNACINAVIQDVNSVWDENTSDRIKYNRKAALGQLMPILHSALQAFLNLSHMDMNTETQDRLNKNKVSLDNIISTVYRRHNPKFLDDGFNLGPKNVFDDTKLFYNEAEYYASCTKFQDYFLYESRYPNGTHLAEVKEWLRKFYEDKTKREEEENKRKAALENQRIQEARKRAFEAVIAKQRERKIEEERIRQLKENYAAINLASSNAKSIDEIESIYIKFGMDSPENALDRRAFILCNNKNDYIKYLQLFPNGIFKKEAKEKTETSFTMFGFFMIIIAIFVLLLIIRNCNNTSVPNENGQLGVVDSISADTIDFDTLEDNRSYNISNNISNSNYTYEDVATEEPEYSEPSYTVTYYSTGDAPFGKGVYDSNSLSELKISNQSDLDAVAVLENGNGKWIRNAFVRNHSTYIMKQIPSCSCILKVMRGNDWNAEKNNGTGLPSGGFMKNVYFSKSNWSDPFDFRPEEEEDGVSYPTYSITLHTVVNGNFHTSPINANEFFK